jgi:Xaa-Pro aminopeptidase
MRKPSAREILVGSSRATELPFSRAEYKSRLKKIQGSMSRWGIDLLYLSSPESLYYVSGYRAEWYQAQSPKPWVPASGIAVRVDEPHFILFDSADEELMVRCETAGSDIRIFPHDDLGPWVEWIVSELKREGWVPGTVGLELWSYRPNRVVSEAFERALQREGCAVVDGSDIVRNLRSVKSAKELEYVERASRIADIGLRSAIETMTPGMTELQVYGEVIRAMSEAGGENPGIPIPVISGERCARSHALASRRVIRRGDIVNIDVCGVYNRYHSNHARTFSIGKPLPEVEKVVELSAGSFELLSRTVKPNLLVSDLVRTMKAYYKRAGIYDDRMWFGGYELGIAFPPDWVGPFVYDESLAIEGLRFRPGMVVNYESNFYLPKAAGASLLINTVVFRDQKARILGESPNRLIVV